MSHTKANGAVDECALCKQRRILLSSHVIPKGCYRRVSGSDSLSVNIIRDKALLSQSQLKASLLCRDCEEKFNKHGERYFLGNCLQRDGSFPFMLKAEIGSIKLKTIRPQAGYWKTDDLGIDYGKIVYFGASLFWRTWAAKRKLPNDRIFIELEPEIAEGLRAYLNGERSDIPKSALNVTLIQPAAGLPRDFRYVYAMPQEIPAHNLGPGVRFYTAECLGLAFTFVSATDPEMVSAMHTNCLLHNPDHPIFITTEMQRATIQRQISGVRNSVPTEHLRTYNAQRGF